MTTFRTNRAPIIPEIPADSTEEQKRFFKAVQDLLYENFRSTRQDLEAVDDTVAGLISYQQKTTYNTEYGFWGNVLWRSSTQIQIKPKPQNGQLFTGAVLNDGSFLSLTTDRTVDITAAGNEGILDGVTRIADSWYRLVAFMGSDESLHFGLSWMPVTTFSNNNPTNALTLNTVTPVGGAATDIGLLFPVGGRLALWNSSAKFETPLFYSGGALDATRDKPKVKSDRSATSLSLVDNLSIANFSANDWVYQVDGFKPVQVSDGAIASAIGARGYMDTGIRIRTDASGNILPFIIIGDEFYFVNGDNASAGYAIDTGLGSFTASASEVNYRCLHVPPDKCGIILAYVYAGQVRTKPYWCTYSEEMFYTSVYGGVLLKHDSRINHGILNIANTAANGNVATRGYII